MFMNKIDSNGGCCKSNAAARSDCRVFRRRAPCGLMSALVLLLALGLVQQSFAQVAINFHPDILGIALIGDVTDQIPDQNLDDKTTLSEATTIEGGIVDDSLQFVTVAVPASAAAAKKSSRTPTLAKVTSKTERVPSSTSILMTAKSAKKKPCPCKKNRSTAHSVFFTDLQTKQGLGGANSVLVTDSQTPQQSRVAHWMLLQPVSTNAPFAGNGGDNDNCENAFLLAIPSLSIGSTSGADVDLDGQSCGTFINSPGVWYSVIGTGTSITASTCTGFFGYDTKISVFCGGCNVLTCVGGNDDNCPGGASGLLSTVTWCSQASAEYLILVHGFGGASGDFELIVSEDGVPCDNPVICGDPVGACCIDGDCVDGVTQAECEGGGGDEGDCCADNGTPGCNIPACQAIVCANDPFCCDNNWDALCADQAANVPECNCGAPGPGLGGVWHEGITCADNPCGPPNDDCSDRIDAFDGPNAFSNEGATTDGPPSGLCDFFNNDQIHSDVWFNYTALCNGDATISLCGGTDLDTKMAVYDGCDCKNLQILACNDDACGLQSEVTIPVTQGNCYKIRIGSFSETTQGSGVFNIAVVCCEPVKDPNVKTQGFWKRVCKFIHPSGEHELLPTYVDCVSDTATFADVADVDDLCDRLNPDPRWDKCEQAEAQFMALMLNVCSGRVATCNCVNDPDLGDTTVGDVIDVIDALLSGDPTFDDCVLAQSVADRINNGDTLVPCK
jgi:hypothetical protein